MLRQVPNLLTCLRLILIPVFVVLMESPTYNRMWWALAVFLVAAGTDLLDGLLARRFGAVTTFGKLVDPLADKLLVMAALVMLTAYHGTSTCEPWIPGWMVALILAREIWVTGLRSLAASRGIVVAASGQGKFKSFLQMTALAMLLIPSSEQVVLPNDSSIRVLALIILNLSIIVSYAGAVEYTFDVFRDSLLTVPDVDSD